MAIAYAVGGIRIGNYVDRAGYGYDSAGLSCKRLCKGNRLIQILFRYLIGNVGVNSLGSTAAGREGLYFGYVAANDGEVYLIY